MKALQRELTAWREVHMPPPTTTCENLHFPPLATHEPDPYPSVDEYVLLPIDEPLSNVLPADIALWREARFRVAKFLRARNTIELDFLKEGGPLDDYLYTNTFEEACLVVQAKRADHVKSYLVELRVDTKEDTLFQSERLLLEIKHVRLDVALLLLSFVAMKLNVSASCLFILFKETYTASPSGRISCEPCA